MWHLKRVPELVRDGKHWTPVDTWMVIGEDDGNDQDTAHTRREVRQTGRDASSRGTHLL